MSARDDFITNQINQAKNSGLSPQDADNQITNAVSNYDKQQNQGALTGPLENLGEKSGLYQLPLIGGVTRGIAQPIARGAEVVGQAVAGPNAKIMSPNDYNQLTQGNFGDATKFGAGVGLQTGLAVTGAKSLPSIAKSLPQLPGYLTKSGVGSKIGAQVGQSVASGATDSWNDFATEVRQAVAKKLGNDQPYQDIVNSRLSAETPPSISPNPQINAQKLQDLRIQAANREPTGIFAKFQGKSPSNQIDEVIRKVASSRLKDLAGTGNLDKLFSVYSKFGSPASIAGKAAIGGLISAVVPEQYKAQAGGGVAGGLEALKILGVL